MSMDNLFGDTSGISNWWNKTMGGVGNFIGDVVRASAAGPGNIRGGIPSNMPVPANLRPASQAPKTGALDSAYQKQMQDTAALGGRSNLQSLIGGELGRQQMPQMPEQQGFMGMSDAELMEFLLGGSGGGGGVDLSGYNNMLSDISGREAGLGTRRGEQEAFLSSLFEAAQGRMATDQEGLAAAVEAALESDQARRATEIGLVRGADAERLATADQARAALGVEGGPDLSSAIAENAVAGVGAGGSVSERDARIRESIERQQLQSQIAGLTPMQQMASTSLNRNYEDRLAALASERAAVQAQMSQARSAGGSRGPSVSEKLAALGFVGGLNAPADAPPAPKLPTNAQGIDMLNYFSQLNPSNANLYSRVYNSLPTLLEGYALDPVTQRPRQPIEIANQIVQANSSLAPAYDFILSLVQRAG